jgi:hypothetical protein
MSADLQHREWIALYDKIQELLRPLGEEDGTEWKDNSYVYVQKDYLLVSDDWGDYQHKLETGNLEFIMPAVINSLRKLLIGYPNWEIVLTLTRSEKESRPAMGLVIRDDEIIDGLRREYLPAAFQSVQYEGSRPLGSKFGDIVYTE